MKALACSGFRQLSLLAMCVSLLVLGTGYAKGENALVDLNNASEQELLALKGVGPATAKKIIASRPYTSVDDLAKAGIGAKTIDGLRTFATVGKATAAAPTMAPEAKTTKTTAVAAKETPAKGASELIDLNTADDKALETLPGIGPALAAEIIKDRPYSSVDDLSRVKGIGKSKLDGLRGQVTVSAVKAATMPPVQAPSAVAPVTVPTKTLTAPPVAQPPAVAPKAVASQLVNINTATKEELDALPGIGPVKAQAIIEARPFEKPEDVMKVKGIKEKEYEKIKDLITIR